MRRDSFGGPEPSFSDRVIELPCGQKDVWEDIGCRCQACFAIYGSIGCSCSRQKSKPRAYEP